MRGARRVRGRTHRVEREAHTERERERERHTHKEMPHRGGRRFSTMFVKKLLAELVTMESEPVKVAKLQVIRSIWITESESKAKLKAVESGKAKLKALESESKTKLKAAESESKANLLAYKEGHKVIQAELKALESESKAKLKALESESKANWELAYKEAHKAIQAHERAYKALEETKTGLVLEVLRARGLNDTRGLLEYLLDKIGQSTHALEGSETTWSQVLQAHPALVQCLRRHLGKSCNLALHLATMYSTLSQDARKDLWLYQGAIVFDNGNLSLEQCASIVCLGTVVGVPCVPWRHLTGMVSQT